MIKVYLFNFSICCTKFTIHGGGATTPAGPPGSISASKVFIRKLKGHPKLHVPSHSTYWRVWTSTTSSTYRLGIGVYAHALLLDILAPPRQLTCGPHMATLPMGPFLGGDNVYPHAIGASPGRVLGPDEGAWAHPDAADVAERGGSWPTSRHPALVLEALCLGVAMTSWPLYADESPSLILANWWNLLRG